jgi:hypothetical protein
MNPRVVMDESDLSVARKRADQMVELTGTLGPPDIASFTPELETIGPFCVNLTFSIRISSTQCVSNEVEKRKKLKPFKGKELNAF